MKDLGPYTCTFENCDTGGQLYDSLSDWRSHEIQVHEADSNQRRCPFCFVDASLQHIAGHLRRIALFALPRSAYLETDSNEVGSASAQLDLGSRDSRLSSLALSSLWYESNGEVDVTKHQMPTMPGIDLTDHALKALPGRTDVDLFDYLGSDESYKPDVDAGSGEYDNVRQAASPKYYGPLMLTSLLDMGRDEDTLASTYRGPGRWKEAETMWTWESELGEEHSEELINMANLTLTYRGKERWKEAEELEAKLLKRLKRTLGEEHSARLISMISLALKSRDKKRWDEAEKLELSVMKTWKRILGEEHPTTLISMSLMALSYRGQKRWEEAERLQMRVVEIRKRVLGEENPNTMTSMANLASIYQGEGRLEKAEELQIRVMNVRQKVLGEDHSDTLISMANLASIYRGQERWAEAEKLELRLMKTRGMDAERSS